MHRELTEDLRRWLDKPGPAKFVEELRKRLVNGGKLRGRLRFRSGPISEDERREIVELLGDRKGTVSTHSVQLDHAAESLRASRYPVTLEELVEARHGTVITKFEAKRARIADKTRQVAERRDELLELMLPVPQLERERALLASMEPSATDRVPPRSATKAGAWPSYATAIKAAAWWWPRHLAGETTPAKGLAASALGGAKKWTTAGKLAFQNLVGMAFDQALAVEDTEIRLNGPLVWRVDDVIVDARLGDPWVSIPASGALRLGALVGRPDGMLLVENQTNFQHVCTDSTVPENWLCVWIAGFASEGLVRFIRKFSDWPLAAWCDLDPSGIDIIQNLMRETGRHVHAVGMEPELWKAAAKRADPAEKRAKWRERAKHLAAEGPQHLRPLAHAIATTGERVEQEELAVYDRVIPTLAERLRGLR